MNKIANRYNVNCSKCANPLEKSRLGKHSYCKSCHTEYVRKNRKKYSQLTDEEKKKANARSYSKVYLKRGIIKKRPCSDCGNEKSEMHHEDYDKPLQVTWLCRKCHLKRHHRLLKKEVVPRKRMPKGQRRAICRCGNSLENLNYRYCKNCQLIYRRLYRIKQNPLAS